VTTNRDLDEILAEIGREHRTIGAPERLEAVLFAAAGKKKKAFAVRSSGFTWNWAAVAILIAAIATAGTIWQIRKRPQPKNQHVQSAPVPQVRAEAAHPSTPVTEKKSVTAKSTRAGRNSAERLRTDRASLRVPSQKPRGWNSLDEFVALPVSEGLAPAADLSVVRVKLRGSDLQQYGLEAPADAAARTMLAEFVIGEDGLPRAIRIVR
jgi:hypothetical protein